MNTTTDIYFLFAYTFGWTPDEVDRLDMSVVADLLEAMKRNSEAISDAISKKMLKGRL